MSDIISNKARSMRLVFGVAIFGATLLLALWFVHPARAVPASFDWGSFDAAGSSQFGVYADEQTVLESGDLVQFLWAGPDDQIERPFWDGTPGGDDQLLDSSAVNNGPPLPPTQWAKGYVPLKTYTFDSGAPYSGGIVYLRAWNAGSAAQATSYGDSETSTLSSGGVFNAPSWQVRDEPTAIRLRSIEAGGRAVNGGLTALLAGILIVSSAFFIIKGRPAERLLA